MEDKERDERDGTQWTDRFWEDPQKIMKLLDLMFLFEDQDKPKICS